MFHSLGLGEISFPQYMSHAKLIEFYAETRDGPENRDNMKLIIFSTFSYVYSFDV